jgi:tetratricopeptide (TPR) repeat protein
LILFQLGDLIGAEHYFAAGLQYFDDPSYQRNPTGGVIAAFGTGSWIAWLLGHTDAARERETQMMAAARGKNPFFEAFSDYSSAAIHQYMREYELAEAIAERGLDLSEKHQFPQMAAYSRCILGRARAELGRPVEGVALIRQAIADLGELGSNIGLSTWTAYLAEAQERAGTISEALETIDQVLHSNSAKYPYRPEALRVRGELRLKLREPETAEINFREAIALAQTMSAKAWELRATISLAQLIRKKGKPDEARTMLADVYNWFTEGFDTADLKDAKALLDELST